MRDPLDWVAAVIRAPALRIQQREQQREKAEEAVRAVNRERSEKELIESEVRLRAVQTELEVMKRSL